MAVPAARLEGSLEFEMSKDIPKPLDPAIGKRILSVNSLTLAVLSFAVGTPVGLTARKPELQHRANCASIQALAPSYISIDISAW